MGYPPRPQDSEYKPDLPPRVRHPILPCGVPQLERLWMEPAVHLRSAPPSRVLNAPNLFPYRVAPGNDGSLKFRWKILHGDHCLSGCIMIFKASDAPTPPIWTHELTRSELERGQLFFDGTINGGHLTVADSPYQVLMDIQTPGRRYRKKIYLEVVVADLRPRALAEEARAIDQALTMEPPEPARLYFERRNFSMSADENDDPNSGNADLAYRRLQAWWGAQPQPEVSLTAEVLVYNSRNQAVPAPAATAGLKLRWSVEPADDVLAPDHPHRDFVTRVSKAQTREGPSSQVLALDAPFVFKPARWAGAHSRVKLSYHHGVAHPGPQAKPSVAGERIFVLWHTLTLASHSAFGTELHPDPGAVRAELQAQFRQANLKFARAFIELRVAPNVEVPELVGGAAFSHAFTAARDAVMLDGGSELAQHRAIFDALFKAADLPAQGFGYHEYYRDEGHFPFDAEAFAAFEGDDQDKGREALSRLLKAARPDPASRRETSIIAEFGVKFSKEIQKQLVSTLVAGKGPGVHLIHMPTEVPSFGNEPRFPGAYTVNVDADRIAVLFRAYTFAYQPHDSFGVTLAHECGHGLYLAHPEKAVGSELWKPERHEPTAAKCLMGYHDDRKNREFCGVCQLRLRGWGVTGG